jgi:DNA-binding transcriptional LysR family regulator
MTPVGRDLAERARDVLVRVGDFEARAKSEAEAGVTTLRLGAIPTVGPFLLPHALPMIRRLKPGMKVYLREELTEALVAGLIEGRLDLILIALPHELPPQITTHPLFEVRVAAGRGCRVVWRLLVAADVRLHRGDRQLRAHRNHCCSLLERLQTALRRRISIDSPHIVRSFACAHAACGSSKLSVAAGASIASAVRHDEVFLATICCK